MPLLFSLSRNRHRSWRSSLDLTRWRAFLLLHLWLYIVVDVNYSLFLGLTVVEAGNVFSNNNRIDIPAKSDDLQNNQKLLKSKAQIRIYKTWLNRTMVVHDLDLMTIPDLEYIRHARELIFPERENAAQLFVAHSYEEATETVHFPNLRPEDYRVPLGSLIPESHNGHFSLHKAFLFPHLRIHFESHAEHQTKKLRCRMPPNDGMHGMIVMFDLLTTLSRPRPRTLGHQVFLWVTQVVYQIKFSEHTSRQILVGQCADLQSFELPLTTAETIAEYNDKLKLQEVQRKRKTVRLTLGGVSLVVAGAVSAAHLGSQRARARQVQQDHHREDLARSLSINNLDSTSESINQ